MGLIRLLLPQLSGVRVDRVSLKGSEVRIEAATAVRAVSCPGCATPSVRLHSRSQRRLTDGVMGGRRVLGVLAVHNLSGAVHKVVTRHRRFLSPPPASAPGPAGTTAPAMSTGRRAQNTPDRDAAVHALLHDGVPLTTITKRLRMARGTERRYARAASADDLIGPNRAGRPAVLTPFTPYLQARAAEGVTDSRLLFTEIRTRGYRGTLRTLQRFLVRARRNERTPPPASVPSARQLTGWIMRPRPHAQRRRRGRGDPADR